MVKRPSWSVGGSDGKIGKAAMSLSDHDYLLARAAQERALAADAADEIVRAVHLKMAHEYSVRAHGSEVETRADYDVIGLASVHGRSL